MNVIAYKLILAFLIGGLIGIERSNHGRAAGMRTHILICVGSTLASSLGLFVAANNPEMGVDPTRIAAQIVASIGVLGAGSVLIKNRDIVTGLTTAAGLWASGIIGLAIGFEFYEGAIIAALIAMLSIAVLNYVEVSKLKEVRLYIEIDNLKKLNGIISEIDKLFDSKVHYNITSPRTNITNNVGIYLKANTKKSLEHKKTINNIKSNILKINNVLYVIEDY